MNKLLSQESPPHDCLKRRADAAEYVRASWGIPCSPNTLAKLAVIGGGPPFRKAGRVPLYARADLDTWAANKLSRRVSSTSELEAGTMARRGQAKSKAPADRIERGTK